MKDTKYRTLAPLSSVARLAYQIPMANGTDTTVIYMIVVLLALAEQVIAMIAGNVPVVSVWFVKLFFRRGTRTAVSPGAAANLPRTVTERFWPDREADQGTPRERRLRKWKRSGASDPYPTVTTVRSTASEEALDPGFRAAGAAETDSRSETWELSENHPIAVGEEILPQNR